MIAPDMQAKLRRSLIEHEGLKKFPYVDTVGKITVGIGYNLSDRGMTDDWINTQYQQDVDYFYNQLFNFPWFQHLTPDRQIVLIDMCFMGWKRFLGFNNMIEALSHFDYPRAAAEMLDSDWAKEVKGRAVSLAQGMLTGVYNV